MKTHFFFIFFISLFTATLCSAQAKTTSKSAHQQNYDKLMVGRHYISLQWISWKNLGSCTIKKIGNNEYFITGTQDGSVCSDEIEGRNNGDALKINGTIKIKSATEFIFTGVISTKIYHINGGEPVYREGEYIFKRTNGRKYWRMQEMQNPKDIGVDYVDIYMK